MSKDKSPKILYLDIETSPIISYTWGLFDQNVALNQIVQDWAIIAWAAKFQGEKKVYYQDQRNAKNITDDKALLKKLWELINESDIIVTQNGKQFDQKKINSRLILNGYKPYSSVKHIDTLQIAKSKFGFTSNKLEYMSSKLCSKFKKLQHKKFPGFELWSECLKGNKSAWQEMERYNKHDVLALEELHMQLQPWDNSFNPNLYTDTLDTVCSCGCKKLNRNGFAYTSMGKFQRFSCSKCGAEVRSRQNELPKEKRKSLKART